MGAKTYMAPLKPRNESKHTCTFYQFAEGVAGEELSWSKQLTQGDWLI